MTPREHYEEAVRRVIEDLDGRDCDARRREASGLAELRYTLDTGERWPTLAVVYCLAGEEEQHLGLLRSHPAFEEYWAGEHAMAVYGGEPLAVTFLYPPRCRDLPEVRTAISAWLAWVANGGGQPTRPLRVGRELLLVAENDDGGTVTVLSAWDPDEPSTWVAGGGHPKGVG